MMEAFHYLNPFVWQLRSPTPMLCQVRQYCADFALLSNTNNHFPLEMNKNGFLETVWATALALAFLRTKMKDEEDLWKLAVDKSVKWMMQNSPDTKIIMDKAVQWVQGK